MDERIPWRREPQEPTTADCDAAAVVLSSGEESTDGEFEFPLVGREHGSPAPADDLFADGRIRPAAFYQVNGLAPASAPAPERRTSGQLGRLLLEESRTWSSSSPRTTGSTASSASTDGVDGVAPESYCVWMPGGGGSSSRPRKSGSTGSSVVPWGRISDLVVGRSHSDGKKFLFLPANRPTPKPRPRPPNPAAGSKKTAPGSEISTVAAAHRIAHYGVKATPRRTFLPCREELVGFFANINGFSRSHAHPY